MKKAFVSIFLLFVCYPAVILGQDYVATAKNLVLFQQFFEQNQAKMSRIRDNQGIDTTDPSFRKMDLSKKAGQRALAFLVSKSGDLSDFGTRSQPLNNRSTNAASSAALFGTAATDVPASAVERTSADFVDSFQLRSIEKEIEWYVKLSKDQFDLFADHKSMLQSEDCPSTFTQLKRTIMVINESSISADFTSGGLSSLVGVSQAEILKGIAEWSISRAQEELLQAFLRQWMETIQNDAILRAMFPNTLNMLSTSDLTSFNTDGDTWKETFQQDLDDIPNEIPGIAEAAIKRAGNPLDESAEQEILAGLRTMSRVFREVGHGKKPDEVLFLLGEAAYLDLAVQNDTNYTIIDRSMIGTNVLLRALKVGTKDYVSPMGIHQLTDAELKKLWCVIYLCEREKLKVTFQLSSIESEAEFYRHVRDRVGRFKIQLTRISENIAGIYNAFETAKNKKGNAAFDLDEFNTYVFLVFDLTENGLDLLSELSHLSPESDRIKSYKTKYLRGYRYVAELHEGVKTKRYGLVALNSVNLLIWLNDIIIRDGNLTASGIDQQFEFKEQLKEYEARIAKVNSAKAEQNPTGEAVRPISIDQQIAVRELKNSLGSEVEQLKYLFPNQASNLDKRWNRVQSLLSAAVMADMDSVRDVLKQHFSFSMKEKEEMVEYWAQSLRFSSESVNKYTKLMAGIILAEDKEDIKHAIQGAAMKTGGYLVRQKSAFSASVSFYPGAQVGNERLSLSNDGFKKGTYLGATLPIGVEAAWGTNWDKFPVGAIGLFLQVLDLGAVLNYSLSSSVDSVAATPEFGFKQVLSPGGYLTVHIRNLPIVLGYGVSFSPELRELTTQTATINANALQHGVFLAIDLNVFPIYSSRKKFPLQHQRQRKSLRTAYEN